MSDVLSEISEALLRCNKCGFCLAGCPIYKVTGIEWTVARGKIALLNSVLAKEIKLNEIADPLKKCLTCNCCVDHCPSGVLTDEIIFKARAELAKEEGQPWIRRLFFHNLLLHPSRLRKMIRSLSWIQASGLRSVAHRLGLARVLGKLGKAESILPTIPSPSHIIEASSTKGELPKYRVAYFIGCAESNLTPKVAEAAIRVLNQHKVDVVIPDFICCGMPAYGYGDIESAITMSKKNIDTANSLEVDAIITTCATCGSMLKRYPDLLSNDADYSEQANVVSDKVKDITQFLVDIGLNRKMRRIERRITYHDPCHLGRFQKVHTQPRQILQSIPGVEFVEMAESNMCCGAAGSFNIEQHDISTKILERKMTNLVQTDADLLVTSCPGCYMQLAYGTREHKLNTEVLQLVELLDMAYRPVSQTNR